MAAIGVHFGYTCACVAVFKDGRADVVANDAGDRVTPAVVAYRETEQKFSGDALMKSCDCPCQIVGIAAKQGRIRNAANTVVKVKQVLGRSFEDPEAQTHKSESKCPVVNKGGKPRYEIDAGEATKFVSPEEVAKLIFHKMKETAQSALGSDVNDAVITVPFEFGEMQKNALRHVLVYKLGGTSLTVTVMEVNSGLYRVLATHTDHSTGGESFTQALAQHLASEFKKSFKHDVTGNPRAMMKLMNSADVAKHTLSTLGSSNCFVDSLYEGMDFDCSVSRARFELLCAPLFNKSIQPIKSLLERVSLSTNDINKVVLCGGSARIPKLQQMIREIFPDVELLNSIPTDEVIPVGAAIEAGILVGRDSFLLDEDSITVDCCAKDILVKEADESGADVYTVLVPSGTPLPARRQHTLQAPGSLTSLCLELYQSSSSSCALQEKVADIVLKNLDPIEEIRDIVTVATMKRDGSLHVTCVEQQTNKSEAITIAAAS
ncbi:heat shock 70 kDa protein 14-like [Scleropages formosus]|uniref:Heat shock 70 kDa protein 14-like n=1 Tax=Scleropages formosus TaxID=113540 RepID=A0A0P7V0G5_SCLFO|nr:heat shock 70 kDa protein 14-like [Scleropages formosus]